MTEKRAKAVQTTEQKVLDYIRAHPGESGRAIFDALRTRVVSLVGLEQRGLIGYRCGGWFISE